MPKATFTSIKPTPAIMACTMASPAKAVMAESVPVSPRITMMTPPNRIMESLSLRSLPILPASTMVSAWKEMGATEPSAPQATEPTTKPSPVGTEANP